VKATIDTPPANIRHAYFQSSRVFLWWRDEVLFYSIHVPKSEHFLRLSPYSFFAIDAVDFRKSLKATHCWIKFAKSYQPKNLVGIEVSKLFFAPSLAPERSLLGSSFAMRKGDYLLKQPISMFSTRPEIRPHFEG
jgi:hypothetical protein